MDKLTHVYFAHIPFVCDGYVCDIRQKEIESCSNFKVKQEKFYIWKLLEIALKQSLGIDIREVEFRKLDNGKWVCDKCQFSLSHIKAHSSTAIRFRQFDFRRIVNDFCLIFVFLCHNR